MNKQRGLVEIPDDLWAFTRLESLNLSSNLITKVPDGAVALTTLIELLCENCRLTSFPERTRLPAKVVCVCVCVCLVFAR